MCSTLNYLYFATEAFVPNEVERYRNAILYAYIRNVEGVLGGTTKSGWEEKQAVGEVSSSIDARTIYEKGAPLDNCVGFIDCTKIQMVRPGGFRLLQRAA